MALPEHQRVIGLASIVIWRCRIRSSSARSVSSTGVSGSGKSTAAQLLLRYDELTGGDILLLENIRFDPRETSKDEAERAAFAEELAALAADDGAFVSDGGSAQARVDMLTIIDGLRAKGLEPVTLDRLHGAPEPGRVYGTR